MKKGTRRYKYGQTVWYLSYFVNGKQNMDALLNIGAFGIYHKADAGITMHCTFNSEEQQYYMEFIYYIIDLYDFTLYEELDYMNALGLARSYELYGVVTGEAAWNKQEGIRGYWTY